MFQCNNSILVTDAYTCHNDWLCFMGYHLDDTGSNVMILSLFQMCIPVILIGCVLRAIILLTQVPEKSFYALVMLMADVVGLVSF